MTRVRCLHYCAVLLSTVSLCAGARGASAVRVDPPVWNYGVRPQAHIVTRRVMLYPDEGEEIRLGVVQIACECLKARVVSDTGSGESPAQIDVDMYTEDFGGATKHSVFLMMERPADTLLRLDVIGWVRSEGGEPRIEAFYAPDEPAGEKFLAWWRETGAQAARAVRVELKPIDDIANYRRLRALEIGAKVSGAAADVAVFVDERIALLGMADIEAGFAGLTDARENMKPGLLPKPSETGAGTSRPTVEVDVVPDGGDVADERPEATGGGPLQVRVYHFSDCRRCRAVIDEVERLAAVHATRVDVRIVDCDKERDEVPRLYALLEAYPDVPQVLPSIIALVGDRALLGEATVLGELRDVIPQQLERGLEAHAIPRPGEPARPDELVGAIALVPVVLAALADGVNPCAFAAIVLLISILSTARRPDGTQGAEVRVLLLGGGAFIVGVFATYYAAGMAALTAIGGLGAFPTARAALFWVVWALAVLGAVFSGADAWLYYRTRDPKRLTLKVPGALRSLFVPILKGRFRRLGLVAGGLASGVIIAILEGVCTGQMYLPTIQYMASTPGLRLRGAAYLFLYNGLFILPLVGILAAAVAGAHFHRLSSFLRRHIGETKIAMAAVFVVLAAGLLLSR